MRTHPSPLVALALLLAPLPAIAQDSLRPPDPGSTVILCHADEPGPRLLVAGQVVDDRGRPLPGAVVTAHNTDRQGLYNPRGSPTRLPRIRGSAVADAEGRFQMLTVRPAAYPNGDEPAHIHFETTCPGYHAAHTAIVFDDDPLVTPRYRARAAGDNETHIITPDRDLGLERARIRIALRPN